MFFNYRKNTVFFLGYSILLTALAISSFAQNLPVLTTDKKIALIIGNSQYQSLSDLPNAGNDADLIGQTLRELGFQVIVRQDLSRAEMEKSVAELSQKIPKGSVVFFFYAGHGLQIGGKNYLVPVDYELASKSQGLWDVSSSLSSISAKSSMNIIVLDSCRNMPDSFLTELNAQQGFSEFKSTPAGTFIGFSTSPGSIALDGVRGSKNSPYSKALAYALTVSPSQLDQVFMITQLQVEQVTGGKQVPWRNSSTKAIFFFSPDKIAMQPPLKISAVIRLPQTNDGKPPAVLHKFSFNTPILNNRGTMTGQKPGTGTRYVEPIGIMPLEMVAIKSGRFLMGASSEEVSAALEEAREFDEFKLENYEVLAAELPQHAVNVPDFFMSRTEITQAQYLAVMGELPNIPAQMRGAAMPVVNVSWTEANEFCSKLSRRTGRFYRLPTEAEWEYAARAGTSSPFAFGETINPQVAAYNYTIPYGKAPRGPRRAAPTDAGSLNSANAFGLLDMHGNVWEWTADYWHSDYDGAPTDGSAWDEPELVVTSDADEEGVEDRSRVVRGGAWDSMGSRLRSASRFRAFPSPGTPFIGFRIVAQ